MRASKLLVALALLAAPASAAPLAVEVSVIEGFPAIAEGAEAAPLLFLGGLQLRSEHLDFGGLSGIDMTADGKAFLIGDTGIFVAARLVHENGRLVGLAEAAIGSLFSDGRLPKAWGDIEDIAFDPENPQRGVIVRERQANALLAFETVDSQPGGYAPVRVGAPDPILQSNRGLESVAYGPPASPHSGEIITIAEGPHGRQADIQAWIAGKGAFTIVRHDGFDVSSARFLPNGDLLLLERRQFFGWGIRLRRIDGSAIAVGARLDGPYLLDAGRMSGIDNMEGLAVHRDEAGRTVLTLVSDDNFSILQRTLILQFALSDD